MTAERADARSGLVSKATARKSSEDQVFRFQPVICLRSRTTARRTAIRVALMATS
jgi:hypothetical protein